MDVKEVAMAYLSAALVILLSLASGLFSVARAGQDETCTMDDKEHKAHYHCPTDYEVVYTGEGTKVCDGKCFKKGDKKSLREAVGELLQRQGLTPMVSTAELDRSVDQLASTGKVSVPTARGSVIFFAPRRER